jgi:hypothetical protein
MNVCQCIFCLVTMLWHNKLECQFLVCVLVENETPNGANPLMNSTPLGRLPAWATDIKPKRRCSGEPNYQLTLLSHTSCNKRVLKYLDLDNLTLSSHDGFTFDLKLIYKMFFFINEILANYAEVFCP